MHKVNGQQATRCINACMPPGQVYCRPDCDLCPKWGAKECVFAKYIPSLAKCDICDKYGNAGCIFSCKFVA